MIIIINKTDGDNTNNSIIAKNEFQMALTNRQLLKRMDTVFFMTDVSYSYLSSSLVQQVSKFGGEVKEFIPEIVLNALKEKFSHE